jgi:hypothetical protein
MDIIKKLKKLNACGDAIEWCKENNITTIQEAWDKCERGDWMLWLYKKLYPDNIRELTLAKGHCANTVRHLMRDKRSIKAVDNAIAFGEGRATKEELKASADAADAAASDASAAASAASAAAYADAADAYAAAAASAYAYAAYADDAAYAAASAADAASAYAYAAYAAYASADDAAYASAAAYDAAASADAYAAQKNNQKQTADICRQYLKLKGE